MEVLEDNIKIVYLNEGFENATSEYLDSSKVEKVRGVIKSGFYFFNPGYLQCVEERNFNLDSIKGGELGLRLCVKTGTDRSGPCIDLYGEQIFDFAEKFGMTLTNPESLKELEVAYYLAGNTYVGVELKKEKGLKRIILFDQETKNMPGKLN